MTAPTGPLSEERRREIEHDANYPVDASMQSVSRDISFARVMTDVHTIQDLQVMLRELLVEIDRLAAENADLQRVLAETILHNADHSRAMLQMVDEAAAQKRGRR